MHPVVRLLSVSLCLAGMAAAAQHLRVGEALPALNGKTLSGKPVDLPAADAGSDRVLVFSFSKAAGSDSRVWNEHLAKDPGPVSYRVIMLESVPGLFRRMAVSGIRSGVPHAAWDRTVLAYKDEKPWKERLAVSNDKHSYVVLLDGEGRVCWMSSGAFSDSEYTGLKEALARVMKR